LELSAGLETVSASKRSQSIPVVVAVNVS
jgi:hypothetical protein